MTPREVLETPAGLLDRMTAAIEAWRAVAQFDNLPAGKGAEWATRNPGAWEFVIEYRGFGKNG